MNAADIWPGSEYAVAPHGKPRSATFVKGCLRIRIIRVYKETSIYSKRGTTFVDAVALSREGNPNGSDLRQYRAYDVVDHWDDYEDLLQEHEVKEVERERLYQIQVQERNARFAREEQERIARKEKEQQDQLILQQRLDVERAEILERLRRRGLDPLKITITSYSVSITREEMLRWLNIQLKQVMVDS